MGWVDEYRKAVIDVVVKRGERFKPDKRRSQFGNYWSHKPGDWRDGHGVGIDYEKSTFNDTKWPCFKGTFYEGEQTECGVEVDLVLADGTVELWRYTTNLSDLTKQIINEGERS